MIRLESFLQVLRPDLITTEPQPLVAQDRGAGSESKTPPKKRMKVHVPKIKKPTKIPDNIKCAECDITIKEILVQILISFEFCF